MKIKAVLALIFATVMWGSSYTFSKMVINDIGPSGYMTFRMLVAFVVLSLMFRKHYKFLNKDILKAGFLAGMPLALSYLLFMIGLEQTSASKTGFLGVGYIIFVPVIVAIYNKELPQKNELIGVLFAIIGILCLSLQKDFSIAFADMVIIVGAFFYAISIVLIGYYANKYDAMLMATLEMGMCFVVAFIYSLATNTMPMVNDFSLKIVLLVLALGIFATAFSTAVQNWAQHYISATTTSIIFVLEPVVAGICGHFIMHDVLTNVQLIGCGFAILGMLSGVLIKNSDKEKMKGKNILGDKYDAK